MTTKRARAAVAAAFLSVLTLAGCAVPGLGEPGVAVQYGDHVVTNDDIADVTAALNELYSPPHPGEPLTLAMIGPEAVEIAADYGYEPTEADLRNDALLWQSLQEQPQKAVSDDALEVVRWVRAISYCMVEEQPAAEFADVLKDIEANSTSSPRSGDFQWDKFLVSVQSIQTELNNRADELGAAYFTVFKDVNGYYSGTAPEWSVEDAA